MTIMTTGVRQGSVLLLSFFDTFINLFVVHLRQQDVTSINFAIYQLPTLRGRNVANMPIC